MVNRVVLNGKSYFGRGSIEKVIDEIKDEKFESILLVTDKEIIKHGLADLLINQIEKTSAKHTIFSEIKPNPTVENVKEGVKIAKENNVNSIIAIGGGSVIDTAKAIGIIMTNPDFEDVVSLEGVSETKNKSLPIIALPTTAGTAAEVTINYVITDEKNTRKMVCVDVHDIPVVSIIDPDLMQTMPQQLAASTGMDALTHAMEGYITKAAWLIPDMFHINAMSLIYKNLEKAANKKDVVAIEKVAYGQYIAGMGFSNVGLGIVHSMAHSLGAFFDTPHGLANALLLPHVMRYNGEVCPDLFRNMANAFGLDTSNKDDKEVIDLVADSLTELSLKLQIPQKLSDIDIPEELLPTLANHALQDICTGGNPRNVTAEDILEIYKKAY